MLLHICRNHLLEQPVYIFVILKGLLRTDLQAREEPENDPKIIVSHELHEADASS
jgi:hypothetical protein